MPLKVIDHNGNDYGSVIYMSSDSNIATVGEDGVVRGVKAGDCRITAYSTEDNSLRDYIDIKVINFRSFITLFTDCNDHTVGIDNSLRIVCMKMLPSLEYVPYNNVTYSIDNNDIAEMVDDKVVGKAVGTVRITITDKADASLTQSIGINVVQKEMDTGISVNSPSRLTVFTSHNSDDPLQANNGYALYVIKDGQSLYYNVTFSIDNTEVVDMDGSTSIRCKSPGTATITITDKADTSINTQLTINVV